MGDIRLDSAADPRIAEYRDLRDPELIRRRGRFVAEGRLVVQRVIEDGRLTIRSLLLSPAAREGLQPSIARLSVDVPIYVCDVDWFLPATGLNIHRGCLAIADRLPVRSAGEVSAGANLVVVLEDVANPDNVGGVFRSAAAFGAGAVLLSPACCDPLYRKAIRTSMASTLVVPFARVEDWPGGLAALRARGFALVALTPRAPATSLDAFATGERPERIALLLGTEGSGLTAAVEAAADCRVRIPTSPAVDSLNLAVAAGIALSRLSRLTNRADLA